MFISLHIPKTAGTSLSTIFDFGCSRRIFYDYSGWDELRTPKLPLAQRATMESEQRGQLMAHRSFIEQNFDFIHGHFFMSKYAGLFPNAKFITCVRQPINRLVSHYLHLLDEADESYWLCREICNGHIDLVEFAQIDFIGNLQSRLLEGTDISDLDYVFVTEKLAESVYYFQLLFNFERNDEYMNFEGEQSIPRSNIITNKKRAENVLDHSIIAEANKYLMQDNELYSKALEAFQRQSSKAHTLVG